MIKRTTRRALRSLGYEIHRIRDTSQPDSTASSVAAVERAAAAETPPGIEPIWPLPNRGGISELEIRARFSRDELWHYAYEFEGGLSFPAHHRNAGQPEEDPKRPLQRFRHFMPHLFASQQGSIKGKRILDIACNSGFWSIQCALMGAEVIGFDARQDLIDQANFIKSVTGANTASFRVLDFWRMSPEELGGKFDIVLNLGILYHLPKPIEALELTKVMAREVVLLDTVVKPTALSSVFLQWEEPFDIRCASAPGIVAIPSKSALDLMFKHLRFRNWREIPLRSDDMPPDYRQRIRASWLLEV